jgi:pectate lyase
LKAECVRYTPIPMLSPFGIIPRALLAIAFATAGFASDIPAFPGAEGFGASSTGGRSGRVIEVTNLDDTGPGSLRAAIEAEGPRTVVFRVGGTIELKTELVLTHPFITIAGQTAPGDGIALKTARSNPRSALTIKGGAHDVIIRYLRIRPGPHDGFPPLRSGREADQSEVKDALQILDAERVIVDHCSFSWATDEVVSTFYNARDVSIQWCIISEALVKARPQQSLPGKGLLIGSKGAERISVHHNLMAHNIGRNPLIKATGVVDVVNNVVLAPDKVAMAIQSEVGLSPANFVGNTVLAPRGEGMVFGVSALGQTPLSIFVEGNIGPHRKGAEQPEELFISPNNNGRRWRVDMRHDAAHVTTQPAATAFAEVLAEAGCTRPSRDAVDVRIVEDVRAQRVRRINDPAEVGGWPELAPGESLPDADHDGMPDAWEKTHRFDPGDAIDGNADPDKDGYTNLEEFLNAIDPHAMQ